MVAYTWNAGCVARNRKVGFARFFFYDRSGIRGRRKMKRRQRLLTRRCNRPIKRVEGRMNEGVISRIREFAESLLPAMGLELYDVQFRRENQGWVLRLIIDRIGGVSLDDCSRVSREVSDFLDVEDLIDHQYHLEVSSPGVERTLRSLIECRRFVGEKIRVKLSQERDGQKVFVGRLQEVGDGTLIVELENGAVHILPWDEINKARLSL
jgi:ribosome maturation factor RimP